MHHFLILGGDSRQRYLSSLLKQAGEQVSLLKVCPDKPGLSLNCKNPSVSLKEAMENSDIILCPIPFSKDKKTIHAENRPADLDIETFLGRLTSAHTVFGGCIPQFVTEYCQDRHIPCFDYLKMEEVACKNAIATAEGAVAEAITLSPVNLRKSSCLITGWGRCAEALADTLTGMGAHVTLTGRNPRKLAHASCHGYDAVLLEHLDSHIHSYSFIFNTIPAMVLDADLTGLMAEDTVVIDIASAPGGVDFEACAGLGIRAKLCPGLPGKYSPLSSARILYEAVLSRI